MGLFDKLFGGAPAKAARPEAVSADAQPGAICAPVAGRVETTSQISDPVFSGEVMGKTVAVWPEAETVYAPIAGTVTTAMPHAFGIEGDGLEVLVHIGIDTVEMNGEGFTVWAKPGDTVSAGDCMVTVDRAKVAAAGHPDIVMCILTNSDDLATVEVVATNEVAAGDTIMRTA